MDTTTCYFCGIEGSGYIADGWDGITDEDGDHDVCRDCLDALDEDSENAE